MIDTPREAAQPAKSICIGCSNADSWGLPDKFVCKSCTSGSAWEPLNSSSVNRNKPQPRQNAQAVPLTGKQRVHLAQAWAMLEDYAADQRQVGNDSIAAGAYASAHEIKLMLNAIYTPPTPQTKAATDVLAERRRQVEVEGWTASHDDEYLIPSSLAEAAACYAVSSAFDAERKKEPPYGWPWAIERWKPSTPRRDLVKAGALILAEIERLDRAHATPQMQQLEGQSE